MAEVQLAAPKLAPHMFMDGAWIWYCGPSIKEDEASRVALKEIGFRFAQRGHVMPDRKTRSYWGHSCDRPTRTKRSGHAPRQEAPAELSAEEILAAL